MPRAQSVLLDAPVKRNTYRLGPGDVVDVSVTGGMNRIDELVVGPEGSLVLPVVGIVHVLGLTLNEAEAATENRFSRYFHNIAVHLTLSQLRQFKVFVVGSVTNPGVRIATSATRASEVVGGAEADSVLRRNIILRRTSGDSITVDLARFRINGDLAANPILHEGDAVIVPTIDQVIRVFGSVAFPGKYEYVSGESLAAFLELVNGGGSFLSTAGDSVRLSRPDSSGRPAIYAFSRAESLGSVGHRFILAPNDVIFVPVSREDEKRSVKITGQVVHPGLYPVISGETTLRALIRMAGGFTPEASLGQASLIRPARGIDGPPSNGDSTPLELLSSEERRIRKIETSANPTRVVVDFKRVFSGIEGAVDPVLFGGDEVNVPSQRDQVVVIGAVSKPGIVPFVAEQPPEYFVDAAGGYSRLADPGAIVVVQAQYGSRIPIADVKSVERGDTIVVPFREDRNWLASMQTANALITSVAGLVLTFIAVLR
jgi:protein involved in polysaccharide export with SLBB domain